MTKPESDFVRQACYVTLDDKLSSASREQIRIFQLPSYSPELNPDELLNQDVNTNALGRVRPVNVQEMMDNVRSYLRITQARPKLVKNYFRECHVQYAAC